MEGLTPHELLDKLYLAEVSVHRLEGEERLFNDTKGWRIRDRPPL